MNEWVSKMTDADRINALEVLLYILKEHEEMLGSILDKIEKMDRLIQQSSRR